LLRLRANYIQYKSNINHINFLQFIINNNYKLDKTMPNNAQQ